MRFFLKRKFKWVIMIFILVFYLSISISSAMALLPFPSSGPVIVFKPLNDTYTIEKNTTNNCFHVLDNDPYSTLFIGLVELDPPEHGTATIAVKTVELGYPFYGSYVAFDCIKYTPDIGYVGTDSFSYEAEYLGTFYGTVVTVNIVEDNILPIAIEDNYTISSGGPRILNVTENDYDPDGDPISIPDPTNDIIQPLNGTAIISGIDNNIIFTPNESFIGHDEFSYRIFDGELYSEFVLVNIEVLEGNNSPIGVDDTYTVMYNSFLNITVSNGLLANDSDPDGDPIHISLVSQPTSGGVVVLNPTSPNDGSFIFVPNGTTPEQVSFTYEVSDGDLTNTATVFISVTTPVVSTPTPTPPLITTTTSTSTTTTKTESSKTIPIVTITTHTNENYESISENPSDDFSQPTPTIYIVLMIMGGVIIILLTVMLLLKIKK